MAAVSGGARNVEGGKRKCSVSAPSYLIANARNELLYSGFIREKATYNMNMNMNKKNLRQNMGRRPLPFESVTGFGIYCGENDVTAALFSVALPWHVEKNVFRSICIIWPFFSCVFSESRSEFFFRVDIAEIDVLHY